MIVIYEMSKCRCRNDKKLSSSCSNADSKKYVLFSCYWVWSKEVFVLAYGLFSVSVCDLLWLISMYMKFSDSIETFGAKIFYAYIAFTKQCEWCIFKMVIICLRF